LDTIERIRQMTGIDLEPVVSDALLTKLGVNDGSLARKIADGSVTLSEIVSTIVPKVVTEPPVPFKAGKAVVLTPKQVGALQTLPAIFGSVAPLERRKLTGEELTALYEERVVVDEILAALKKRKEESIRDAIVNHFDVKREDEYGDGADGSAPAGPRTKDGHVLISDKEDIPGTDKVFSWEVSGGAPEISDELLKRLDAEGKIDHKLYLEITEPVRVLNEQKLLLALSRQPDEAIALIKAASVPTAKKGSLYVRAAK
jgi:hypothetical protein